MGRRMFILAVVFVLAFHHQLGSTQSLRGSRGSQVLQNEMADQDNLTRIEDAAMLERFKKAGLLVPILEVPGIVVDPRLAEYLRYVRPWTLKFLTDIGHDFRKKFGADLQVNSAVRTAMYQETLRESNGNAASPHGPRRSSHLTGATIDIAKLPLEKKQIEWLRKRLLALEKTRMIEVTEEQHQAVFHIMVFKRYKPK